MKKTLYKEIKIPEGVNVEIGNSEIKVSGPEGENTRRFRAKGIELAKKGDKLSIGSKNATKNEKKIMNTLNAHIKNMINGVQKKFEYELKAVFSHFPITIEVKGNEVIIKNFLGEKIPRKAGIPSGAEVKVEGNLIKISSTNREIAGQAAANLETATKIRARDKRIFQDGIFMIKKAGREI